MCFPFFLFSFVWASPFVPFLFLCLSLLLFFLPSFLSFLFLLLAFSFCFLCFLLGSRFYFVVFFVSACCLVLFWIIMFDLLLFSILFSGCCCFLFLLLSYFAIFENWQPIKKHVWKNWILQKSQKWKMHKKKDILTKAVSTKVLTNSVFFSFLCFFKFCIFCWKHYKNRGFSQKKRKKHKKNKKPSVKNWSKLALKTGPIMLRNKIGPVFNARNGSFFCFFVFFEKSSSFCRENEIFKNKQNKTKKWTSF